MSSAGPSRLTMPESDREAALNRLAASYTRTVYPGERRGQAVAQPAFG